MLALARTFWDNSATGFRSATFYPAQQGGATTAYVPLIFVQDDWVTLLTLQNLETVPVTVTLHFAWRSGLEKGTCQTVLPAAGVTELNLSQVPGAALNNVGSAWAAATGRIIVLASTISTTSADAYVAPSGGEPTLWVPGTVRWLVGSALDSSGLSLQNTGSVTATVHAQFIRSDGVVSFQFDDTIAPKGVAGYSTRTPNTLPQATFDALVAALGSSWRGTIKVVSTNGQPLAGQSTVTPSYTGAGLTDRGNWLAVGDSQLATTPLLFPLVNRRGIGGPGELWSQAFLLNAGAAGTVQVAFYDTSGQQRGSTYTLNAPANRTLLLDLKVGGDLPPAALTDLGSTFTGSLVVTPGPGVRLAGVDHTYWIGEQRMAAYNALPLP